MSAIYRSVHTPLRAIRRGFTLIEIMVVILVLAVLAAIMFPVVARIPQLARDMEDVNHLHSIISMLNAFQQDQGTLPTNSTAFIERMTYQGEPSSSNDFFAQLFTERVVDGGSEALFFVSSHPLCRSGVVPDGVVTDESGSVIRDRILVAGTCGWAYIGGLDAETPGSAPVVLDSPTTGQFGDPFDLEMRAGKVLVARLNQSVAKERLDPDRPAWVIIEDDTGQEIVLNDLANQNLFGKSMDTAFMVGPTAAAPTGPSGE